MVSKINFYINRISSMSIPEILYRIKWKAYTAVTQRLKAGYNKKNFFSNPLEPFKKDNSLFFDDLPYEVVIKEYKSFFDIKKIIKDADKLCEHIIPIFDIKDKNLGKSIDWNKDYKSNKTWPKKYVSAFHHADIKHGDVRYVWELNRHSHLTLIAKAYYLTKNDKYAEETLKQIESWLEQNPYLHTINWFSGLEVGVRLINWVWCLKFVKHYGGLTEERFANIVKFVYLQADTIYHNMSLYSSANNHLTGEIAALKLAAKAFPYFKDAGKWNRKCSNLLDREVINQIYDDGTGAEQSINYLLFILDLFIQVFFIADKKIPDAYQPKIYNSGHFLAVLLQNRNHMPDIGDSDYAHLIDFEYGRDKTESMMNCLSVIFNDGYSRDFGKQIDEKAFWIFGIEGLDKYKKIDRKKVTPASKLFKDGGYFCSNSKNASLIFDCGPLGYLSTAGHGHCDALSFTLAVDKKDFFVDPGTYSYHGDVIWRNYFRSTRAHNTIMIDREEQSEVKGTFIYGRKANCVIKKSIIEADKDKICAYHDGYKKLGVIHEREIVHDKHEKKIIIKDKIKTSGKHSVKLYFNLHPNVKIIKELNKDLYLKNNNTEVKLTLDKNLTINKYYGNTNPIFGWYSPEFGVKVACLTIEGKVLVDKDTELITVVEY